MARPREFDDAQVREALRDVFWQNGYDGTSYADIMAATGLKKGSLYASYGDKRALYQTALAAYETSEVRAGLTMLQNPNLTSREKVAALFDGIIGSVGTPRGRWGCLLCNAASDQAPLDADTEDTVKSGMTRLRNAIEYALSASDKGQATSILAAYFGARLMVKAGFEANAIEAIKAQTLKGMS